MTNQTPRQQLEQPRPITWTAPAGTPIAGITFSRGTHYPNHPDGGNCVDFGVQKIGKKKTRLLVRIEGKADLQAEVERHEREQAEYEAEVAAAIATAEPAGFLFELGCDSANTYRILWPDELDELPWDVRRQFDVSGQKLIEKHLGSREIETIAGETGAQAVEATGTSYYGWQFDRAGYEALLAAAQTKQAEQDAAKDAKQQAHQERIEAAIAEARRTGQNVEIEHWTEGCCDPHEECSLDIVVRVAKPDGTIGTTRSHTY